MKTFWKIVYGICIILGLYEMIWLNRTADCALYYALAALAYAYSLDHSKENKK